MATANSKASKNTDTPKRKVLSPAERVAKIEADLKAAKERMHAKDAAAIKKADDELTKLRSKRAELDSRITELEADKAAAQSRIEGPVTDGVGEADSDA